MFQRARVAEELFFSFLNEEKWVTISRIRRKTGASNRTVTKVIKTLVGLGVLSSEVAIVDGKTAVKFCLSEPFKTDLEENPMTAMVQVLKGIQNVEGYHTVKVR